MDVRAAAVLLVIGAVIAIAAVSGACLMLLWNWIVPIFWAAAPSLTFFQAVGASLLLGFIGSAFRSATTRE